MNRIFWLFGVFLFGSCGIIHWPDAVETGFEDVEREGDSLWISLGDQHYLTSASIDSVAFEGHYSLFATDANQVVLEYTDQGPEPDAKYLLTVWCRTAGKTNGGAIVAVMENPEGLTEIGVAENPVESQGGWEKRELLVQLPPQHDASAIHFRLQNRSDDPVWFDDFRLEFLEKVYYPEFDYSETMHIRISEPDLERLREKRLESFSSGYIDMEQDDWIRAEIEWNDTVMMGNMTLKGDQLYNLEGDKWTLKVELDEGTLGGMRYFSLHHPELRNFLDEWLFHEILKQEEIVCSEYGFTPLTFNGRSLGIYAYEERLLDEMYVLRDTINSIARFRDLGFVKSQLVSDSDAHEDPLKEAGIQIFSDEAFDKELSKEFKQRIKEFRDVEPGVSQWFDHEKTARMLAICDVMEAYGSLHWTNIRMISDAANGKIELVGNDGFSHYGRVPFRNGPFMAWSDQPEVIEHERWRAMYLNLFNDSTFMRIYQDELRRVSDEKFLNVTKLNTIGELKYYQSILVEEWPAYRFDYSRLYKRARKITEQLRPFGAMNAIQPVEYRFEPND